MKTYMNPEIEIVLISTEDVIATSFGDTLNLGNPTDIDWTQGV